MGVATTTATTAASPGRTTPTDRSVTVTTSTSPVADPPSVESDAGPLAVETEVSNVDEESDPLVILAVLGLVGAVVHYA